LRPLSTRHALHHCRGGGNVPDASTNCPPIRRYVRDMWALARTSTRDALPSLTLAHHRVSALVPRMAPSWNAKGPRKSQSILGRHHPRPHFDACRRSEGKSVRGGFGWSASGEGGHCSRPIECASIGPNAQRRRASTECGRAILRSRCPGLAASPVRPAHTGRVPPVRHLQLRCPKPRRSHRQPRRRPICGSGSVDNYSLCRCQPFALTRQTHFEEFPIV
jgi:hypothetical protein